MEEEENTASLLNLLDLARLFKQSFFYQCWIRASL